MKIYLDNSCFNRPFDDQKQLRIQLETEAKLDIQERIFQKEIELTWSYILDLENEANPFEQRRIAIKGWKNYVSLNTDETKEIIGKAERFISLVMREPFDYTKWQRTLWVDKSVAEISAAAMQLRKKSKMQGEKE